MKKIIVSVFVLLVLAITVQAQKKETRNVDTFTEVSYRIPGKLYLRQGSPQKVELQGNADVLAKIETSVEGKKLVIETDGKRFNWSDDDVTVYITVKDISAVHVAGSGEVITEGKITAGRLDLKVSGSGSVKARDVEANEKLQADVAGSGSIDVSGKSKGFESHVSGSGKVVANGIGGETIKMNVSGSGKIHASGSGGKADASISGSGKILAADLEVERIDIRISGSGDMEINVKEEIEAHISGSGKIAYKGNPRKVNSHSSGSGTIRKL